MPLPENFQFSASSLQDYVDCPRRFELRYLLRLSWPALETEPVLEREHHQEQGRRFHQMVQQHLLGFSPDQLNNLADTPELQRWWQNYLNNTVLDELPPQRRVEYTLSISLNGFRVTAQYDLLAVQPGERAVIVDWKTSAHNTPRSTLIRRIQTRLYPLVLCLSGQDARFGVPLSPDQVEMIYWFTDYPNDPQRFPYTAAQMSADQEEIERVILDITNRRPGDFPLTANEQRCQFCRYRSLCQRGVQAGDWQNQETSEEQNSGSGFDLDFDQIAEIDF